MGSLRSRLIVRSRLVEKCHSSPLKHSHHLLFSLTRGIREHLEAYRKCLEATYAQHRGISVLLEAAGQRCRSFILCSMKHTYNIYVCVAPLRQTLSLNSCVQLYRENSKDSVVLQILCVCVLQFTLQQACLLPGLGLPGPNGTH